VVFSFSSVLAEKLPVSHPVIDIPDITRELQIQENTCN